MSYIGNKIKISTANSTTTPLSGGATFTGAYEDISAYSSIEVIGVTDSSGTIYFDFSTDGTNLDRAVQLSSGSDSALGIHGLAVVSKYGRLRLVNGVAAQSYLRVQTIYSGNAKVALPTSRMAQSLSDYSDVLNTRAVIVGKSPDGTFDNNRQNGKAFSTITPLASLAVYDSGILDLNGYTQVQTEIIADQDGTLDFIFYEDSAGTDIVRSISIPYLTANGYQLYSAPTFGYYVRYKFTNTSASLQTDFYYTTKFTAESLSAQILAKTGFIAPTMTANLSRNANDFNTDRNIGLIGGQESKRKFGVNQSVSSSLETVWSYSANWIPNQVVNEKLRIKAGGNAADDTAGLGAQTITVNFLDENWLEVTETIVTAGASASTATTANCVRVLSAKVINVGTYHGANTGGITLELTGGNIMGYLSAGKGTTEQAIYTAPSNKTVYITEIIVSVGQGDSADIKLFTTKNSNNTTTPFSSRVEQWTLSDFSGAQIFTHTTHLKIESYEDVWFEAEKITGAGNARVSIDFNYYTVAN